MECIILRKTKLLISDLYMILFSAFLLLLTILKVCITKRIADEVVTFGAIYFLASFVWLKLFTSQKPDFEQKRFLVQKERGILLVITFVTELLFIIVDLFSGKFSDSWYWTVPAFIATDLWITALWKTFSAGSKLKCSTAKNLKVLTLSLMN